MREFFIKTINHPPVKRKNDLWAREKRIAPVIDFDAVAEKIKLDFLKKPLVLEAFARLVIELKDNLSEYDTILSDDTSGRLVSLFLRRLINQKRKIRNRKPVQTFFLASERPQYYGEKVNTKEIEKFIARRKKKLGRTLLVTEFIASGGTMMRFVNILEKEGIDYDVAALLVSRDLDSYDKKLTKSLYFGKRSGGAGDVLYGRDEYTGVKKIKKTSSAHPVRYSEFSPEKVAIARKDIAILAKEFSKLLQ